MGCWICFRCSWLGKTKRMLVGGRLDLWWGIYQCNFVLDRSRNYYSYLKIIFIIICWAEVIKYTFTKWNHSSKKVFAWTGSCVPCWNNFFNNLALYRWRNCYGLLKKRLWNYSRWFRVYKLFLFKIKKKSFPQLMRVYLYRD